MEQERETSNLPLDISAELAKELAAMASKTGAAAGAKIRANGNSSFILPDQMETKELEAVIVDFVTINSYFDRPYVRGDDSPKIPACYAVGYEVKNMAPATDAPAKQAASCKNCPMNQFGSAPTGKAKACKNTRMLALMPAKVLDPENAPIYMLSVPPGSLTYFDKYVNNLATRMRLTPISVKTKISLDPKETFYAPRFDVIEPLTQEELGFYFKFRGEAKESLMTLPDFSQYVAPVSKR